LSARLQYTDNVEVGPISGTSARAASKAV